MTEETKRKIADSKRGLRLSQATKEKIGAAFRGKPLSDQHRKKISEGLLRGGAGWWNIGRRASNETRAKMSAAKRGRPIPHNEKLVALAKARTGSKNPSWKGGISTETRRARNCAEGRKWRAAVLKRDGYRCVRCCATQQLQADHIKSFTRFPELRYEMSNGRTLCFPCHRQTETWGYGPYAHATG